MDLIEKKPDGMLILLDDEIKAPRATDDTFLTKLKKAHDKHPRFESRVKGHASRFILKHYAGEVKRSNLLSCYGF